MKFALVNGQRTEAQTGLSGECPGCKAPVIAICGVVRIWHWRHVSKRMCDQWWENETEWHRAWKNNFPIEWQEFIQHAPDGEKHIADVKTAQGWVIEFQYSHLRPEERRARTAFYQQLVWVVNGRRRKRDPDQFFNAVETGKQISTVQMLNVPNYECRLLKEWRNESAPVFFDFAERDRLWCLIPGGLDGWAYVGPFPREGFVELLKGGMTKAGETFPSLMKILNGMVAEHVSQIKAQIQRESVGFNRPDSFQMFLQQQRRRRWRL
jgi:competence protein CoiA